MIYDTLCQYVDDLIALWQQAANRMEGITIPSGVAIPMFQGVSLDDWPNKLKQDKAVISANQSDPRAMLSHARISAFEASLQYYNRLDGWAGVLGGSVPREQRGQWESLLGDLRRLGERLGTFIDNLNSMASEVGARFNLHGLRNTAEDVFAYPLLTKQTGHGAGHGSSGTYETSGYAGSIGSTVHNALREVLSWRPRTDDPKGFVAALTHSFVCDEVDGRTLCKWRPRSYAVQADIGAVTGAQASIFTRAKTVLDQARPLVEGLSPLRPDADKENTEAHRSIVVAQLAEMVNEMGREGGPRVQRVDALFELLVGVEPTATDAGRSDPETVRGELGRLRGEFGFTTSRVNTVDEERNLTNFNIVVDYVNSLLLSWSSQRDQFTRDGSAVYLGTQLILLSRALAVTAESVHEVYEAMDSVFLGKDERQTTQLSFTDGSPPIFIEDLLSWAHTFATEEGRRLIDEGGKRGVHSLFPAIDRLRELVRASLVGTGSLSTSVEVPAGYTTSRVQRAMQELADHLDGAAELAIQLLGNNGS